MGVESRVALINALAGFDAGSILGTPESAWVDFKSEPYKLDNGKQRWEFLKDILAMANSQGGLIVIGIKTTRESHQDCDVATDLTPFKRQLVDADRLVQAARDGTIPGIVLGFHWYDSQAPSTDPNSGESEENLSYLVIEINPLEEHVRPGVIRRLVNDDGKALQGVAVPVRHGGSTRWHTADELYRLINDGARRPAPAMMPSPLELRSEPHIDPLDSIEFLDRSQDWDNEPVLYLQSVPTPLPSMIPGWLDTIRDAITHQQPLRSAGFHFANPYEQLRQEDQTILIGDSRMALSVDMCGIVTAGALATGEFLGWAMDARGNTGQLNVVSITEVVIEYFRFVHQSILPAHQGQWTHTLRCYRFQSADPPRRLPEGHNPDFPRMGTVNGASSDEWEQSWLAAATPEVDAYQALTWLYALFGVSPSTNPYVQDGSLSADRFLQQFVDEEKLR